LYKTLYNTLFVSFYVNDLPVGKETVRERESERERETKNLGVQLIPGQALPNVAKKATQCSILEARQLFIRGFFISLD
jgi:hypothetical protein